MCAICLNDSPSSGDFGGGCGGGEIRSVGGMFWDLYVRETGVRKMGRIGERVVVRRKVEIKGLRIHDWRFASSERLPAGATSAAAARRVNACVPPLSPRIASWCTGRLGFAVFPNTRCLLRSSFPQFLSRPSPFSPFQSRLASQSLQWLALLWR